MGKLSFFNFVTLNGFFKGEDDDIGWHKHGDEEHDFAVEGAQSNSTLLFGRKTYEMMASYWPTPMAFKNDPVMAKGMNDSKKIVFSRTLKNAEWSNTTIIANNMIEEVRRLKKKRRMDMTILGSGSIAAQLAGQNLIDEFQIMIDPVVLGNGTPLLDGITHALDLKLTSVRSFKSGVVLVCYKPAS